MVDFIKCTFLWVIRFFFFLYKKKEPQDECNANETGVEGKKDLALLITAEKAEMQDKMLSVKL